MMPVEVLEALMADGVEFSTDGEMVRWRLSDGWMKPEVISILKAGKSEVIAYLQRRQPRGPAPGHQKLETGQNDTVR